MKFAIKTFGWAVVSGFIIYAGQLLGGSASWPALVATLAAVALKTPFYAVYEWAFHRIWPHDYPKAEPLEHLPTRQEEVEFLASVLAGTDLE